MTKVQSTREGNSGRNTESKKTPAPVKNAPVPSKRKI